MRSYKKPLSESRSIFVGVDVHLSSWHITIRTREEIVGQVSLGGSWEELKKVISRWRPEQVLIVYEAGFSGFWLYDEVVTWGAECVVVPPSRIPDSRSNALAFDIRPSKRAISVNTTSPVGFRPPQGEGKKMTFKMEGTKPFCHWKPTT